MKLWIDYKWTAEDRRFMWFVMNNENVVAKCYSRDDALNIIEDLELRRSK